MDIAKSKLVGKNVKVKNGSYRRYKKDKDYAQKYMPSVDYVHIKENNNKGKIVDVEMFDYVICLESGEYIELPKYYFEINDEI